MKIFGQLAVTEIQGKYIWSPFTTRSSSPFACQNGLQQHKKMSLEGINRKSYNVVGQWCNNDNARWRRKNLSLSWIINNGFLVLEHLAGRIFRFLFIIFYFSLVKKNSSAIHEVLPLITQQIICHSISPRHENLWRSRQTAIIN